MVRRPHLLAWMLTLEGAILLLCGGGLVAASRTGRVAALLGSGGCTGALAFVGGPVLEWLCGALGAVLGLLGGAGLVTGRSAFRRRHPVAARTVLLAYAMSWGVLATLACLRASAPQSDLATSLAAGAIAAMVGLLHVIAARSPSTPGNSSSSTDAPRDDSSASAVAG